MSNISAWRSKSLSLRAILDFFFFCSCIDMFVCFLLCLCLFYFCVSIHTCTHTQPWIFWYAEPDHTSLQTELCDASLASSGQQRTSEWELLNHIGITQAPLHVHTHMLPLLRYRCLISSTDKDTCTHTHAHIHNKTLLHNIILLALNFYKLSLHLLSLHWTAQPQYNESVFASYPMVRHTCASSTNVYTTNSAVSVCAAAHNSVFFLSLHSENVT